jgi:hypothetical protein
VRVERKLTAILYADVHGYSRLMGGDEEATLATLTAHRKVIGGLIEQHHGHFVNSADDSVLAEFASVVEAVTCAVDIQTALKVENAKLPPERRMEFRIGVNLGDVMVEDQQIYGYWRQPAREQRARQQFNLRGGVHFRGPTRASQSDVIISRPPQYSFGGSDALPSGDRWR